MYLKEKYDERSDWTNTKHNTTNVIFKSSWKWGCVVRWVIPDFSGTQCLLTNSKNHIPSQWKTVLLYLFNFASKNETHLGLQGKSKNFCPILTIHGFTWQIFIEVPSIKFHRQSSVGSWVDTCIPTDRQNKARRHFTWLMQTCLKSVTLYLCFLYMASNVHSDNFTCHFWLQMLLNLWESSKNATESQTDYKNLSCKNILFNFGLYS